MEHTRPLPPPLAPGARVALVAPAGPLRGASDIERSCATVRSFGWEPVVGAHVLARAGWLAGDDAERRVDLQRALDDPMIDAVWVMRGGYGTARLLPSLSFDGIRARPKAVLGYSDATALHAAIARAVPVATFHAPVARGDLPPEARASLLAAVTGSGEPCGHAETAWTGRGGSAAGVLAGGNLAVLASLCGTPWAPRFAGCLVILEDVHEASYRVDRMLRQLEWAGAFDGCAGIVGGRFTDVPADASPDAPSCDTVVAELAGRLGVPCLLGAPIGHIPEQWTVPLGVRAALDADARILRTVPPGAARPRPEPPSVP